MFVYRNFGAGSPFCERILSKSLNSKSSWSEAFVVPLIAKLHIGTKEQIYKHTKMNNPMWKSGAIIRNDILIYCNKPPNQSLRSFEGLLLFCWLPHLFSNPLLPSRCVLPNHGRHLPLQRGQRHHGTSRSSFWNESLTFQTWESMLIFPRCTPRRNGVKKKLCRLNLCDMWIFLVLKKKFLKW